MRLKGKAEEKAEMCDSEDATGETEGRYLVEISDLVLGEGEDGQVRGQVGGDSTQRGEDVPVEQKRLRGSEPNKTTTTNSH